MGGIGALLDLSRRSLNTQSVAIKVTGDNIANVNTEGYSRRRADLVATQASGAENLLVGTGVSVNGVIRVVDTFLNSALAGRVNDRAAASARSDLLSRAEEPFGLDEGPGHIGYEMGRFFAALQDLASNPSDIALRNQVLQFGDSLGRSINTAYNQIAALQREADTRIGDAVNEVNRLGSEIAGLNGEIATTETSGQQNLTLRDQRDLAFQRLSELVPVSSVEQSDGTINVSLPNGFALVNGTNVRSLGFVTNPSFAPPGGYPPGLDGGGLGHVVYDFDQTAGVDHVDLTQFIRSGGGTIGGLLATRGTQSATDSTPFDASGDLPEIASRIEAMARDLLTRFNVEYRGPDEDAAGTPAVVEPSSFGLDGSQPGVFGLFTFAGAADDGDGAATATDLAASGFSSFANRIQFGVTDPRALAAARDLDPVAGSTSFASGDASNLQGLLSQRSAVRPAPPAAGSLVVGSYAMTSTIEQVYTETVSFAGGKAAAAKTDFTVAQAQEAQTREIQQSISGVNLDEEFAKLINFQRAFEASARLVRVGDELLSQVISLLG